MNQYTLFVGSSDSFSDCWNIFFTLLKKYWPGFNGEIILATESRVYRYDGLNIHCPVVQNAAQHRLTWSEVMYRSLEQVNTPYVLFMLEDYFIKSRVNTERLQEMFDLMVREDFDHLMLIPMPGNNTPTAWPGIVERAKDAPYRLSTQTGFWKKEVLMSYFVAHESPWQFEHWGTRRAERRNHRFYSLHPDDPENKGWIIDYYIRGAVTKGKWQQSVPDFLAEQDITPPDFSIRGFYDAKFIPPLAIRIRRRIAAIPGEVRSWIKLNMPE